MANDAELPEFGVDQPLVFEETACPVCHSGDGELTYTKHTVGCRLTFYRCPGCRTLYQNPRLTVESLRGVYANERFYEGKDDNLNYYSFLAGEEYLSATAASRLSRIAPFAKGKKLLEVASAAGFFLKEAKRAGYDATGVEFSEPMATYASERFGVEVIPESIELIDLPDETYDVIASWGLFTILRDPRAVIEKFHRALKPGGVWAFNTYYSESLWGRLFRQRWMILVPNTSQIHSDVTLRRMVEESGFEIVSVERDWPYASVERILFALLSHFPGLIKNSLFDRLHILNRIVLRIPTPDVREYLCVKR